jgi:hypothetical protein
VACLLVPWTLVFSSFLLFAWCWSPLPFLVINVYKYVNKLSTGGLFRRCVGAMARSDEGNGCRLLRR